VVGPVVKHASCHDASEVAPVVGALFLRNYEIKGPSDRLACDVTEDVLGGLVPITNDPLAVRRNDRIRARLARWLVLLLITPRLLRCASAAGSCPYARLATLEPSSIKPSLMALNSNNRRSSRNTDHSADSTENHRGLPLM
jgi:hypothetical protein